MAVGRDKTGLNVKGKNEWAWTWQTQQVTLIGLSESRGAQAVSDYFPKGFERAVLVHDSWAAQLNTPAKAHQLSVAHLL
ncbi:MAG: transposase [Kiritimatiellae bacterium]|nr:transposase [Kiritimatiellia bacterium]